MEVSTLMNGIRSIFISADRGIYLFVGALYELITGLSRIRFVENVAEIQNKLYSFIAIFMLFKISFSIINYIINPESISDKEKGGSKMITNVVITFVLIIVTPFGFDLLYEAQDAVLDDNILPRIILGKTDEEIGTYEFSTSAKCNSTQKIEKTGDYVAMMTFRTFIPIDSSVSDSQVEDLISKTNYCTAGTIAELLDSNIVNHPGKKVMSKSIYTVNYNIILSTVAGIIILLLFVGFCFDVALRSVKLAFLQIIAPIPIMSYVDPKSSKSGMFSKWLKEVGTTWADLFLRLSAVYFAIFIITTVKLSEYGSIPGLVFLIGTLLFAKKLPDILKKIFNIDLKGDFSLNPLKKVKDAADFAKPVTGLAGGAVGLLAGASNFARGNTWKQKLVNGFSGMKKGAVNGYKNPYSITKGGLSSLSPAFDSVKKRWQEQDEAATKLNQYDKFNQKGRDLVKNILKTDENGNYILDDKGNYQIDEEKRSKLFEKNKEYQDSFNRVNNAKTNLKNAKNEYQAAQSNLERLNSNPNATKEQLDAALKNVNAKREAVDKAQGALDGVKERHKIIQQKYTKDAEVESAVKEYLDRTSDRTLDSLGINTGNVNIQTSSSQLGNPSSTSQSANPNNYNGNLNYQNYSKIEEDIKNAEAIKRKKLQEYYKETDEEEKNRISSEISKYEEQISELKNEREDMNNDHPEVAADYIENVVIPSKNNEVNQIQKEMDALYNTFKNPDVSIQNYGADYPTNPDYQKAKAEYALKQEYLKAETSNIYSLGQRVKEFRQKANNLNTHQSAERQSENINTPQDDQTVEPLFESNNEYFENDTANPNEEQEKLETQKRKEYLISELDKYRKEESEIKKHYGVLEYSKTREYKDIQAKIEEIEDELYHL